MKILFRGITTVSVVLIHVIRNTIFIKSDKYFQGNGIFSFAEMWKEYQAKNFCLILEFGGQAL